MQISARLAKNMESDYISNIIKNLLDYTGQPVKNLARLLHAGVPLEVVRAIVKRIPDLSEIFVDIAFDLFRESKIELFKEYLDLGIPQKEIQCEGRFLESNYWPSIEENVVVSSPLGSGKSSCIIQKVKENQDKRILIICPRNEICDQYVEWLRKEEISFGYLYARYKNKKPNIIVTNFDKAPQLLHEQSFDWIIVDEFHAMCDDDLFRASQNRTLEMCLYRAISFTNSKVHLVSATPKRGAMRTFQDCDFTSYIFFTQKEQKPLSFYITRNPLLATLDLIAKTNERCIVHQNHILNNDKLTVLLSPYRKCASIHAETRELLNEKLSEAQCVFVTSVIDSGKSIDDGIPSQVFTIGKRERLSSLLQRVARVRTDVSKYNIILKKTKTPCIEGEPLQVWNCGAWDFDDTNIPSGWSGLRNTREDYIQKDDTISKAESDFALLEELVANPNLILLFNQVLAPRYGFYIDNICYDYERANQFSIDIFVEEFKKIYTDANLSDIIFLLSSIQVLGYMQQLPESLNAFFDFMLHKHQIDHSIVKMISDRFLALCQNDRIIALDAQKEISDFCIRAIQVYGLDNESIPSSFENWSNITSEQRKSVSELGSQLLTSLACVADPKYIRAEEEDPIQFNVGKLFKFWLEDRDKDSFSIADIEMYIGRYIQKGWIPAFATQRIFIGNPNFIERSRIYKFFKMSLTWVCDRTYQGNRVFYKWNNEKWQSFQFHLEKYTKISGWLQSNTISYLFKRYKNIHRRFHLCYPLFQELAGEV